jgi:hypothetical protein
MKIIKLAIAGAAVAASTARKLEGWERSIISAGFTARERQCFRFRQLETASTGNGEAKSCRSSPQPNLRL